MIQNRYKLGVGRAKTRAFPGEDIGSDHDISSAAKGIKES